MVVQVIRSSKTGAGIATRSKTSQVTQVLSLVALLYFSAGSL